MVAGRAAMRLDELIREALGDLSQAQKLLLEYVPARAVLAKLALVFGKDIAAVASGAQGVAG